LIVSRRTKNPKGQQPVTFDVSTSKKVEETHLNYKEKNCDMESRLLILGMHRVGMPPPNAKIRGLFITPTLLQLQISILRAIGFRFTTLNDALANSSGNRAVVTFDDGYADNFTNAYPILRSLDVPATVFVITGDVGSRNVVWDESGDHNPSDILDWAAIQTLQDSGWEIGSHANEHIHLSRYTRAQQEKTIRISIDAIEGNTGKRPMSFAYPYGNYNDETKSVLTKLGIRYAVTTKAATADGSQNDLLELERTSLGGRHFYHFFKNFLRTRKAIGNIEMARGLSSHLLPAGLTEAAGSLFFSQINK
jgi:peptidoglycan/xylan/chitin deacetylase (PgdA/CDA1 family)